MDSRSGVAKNPSDVVSCAGRELSVQTLEAFGLAEIFRVVVTGSEVGNGKPNPDIFSQAAAQVRISPYATLLVEDSVSGLAQRNRREWFASYMHHQDQMSVLLLYIRISLCHSSRKQSWPRLRRNSRHAAKEAR